MRMISTNPAFPTSKASLHVSPPSWFVLYSPTPHKSYDPYWSDDPLTHSSYCALVLRLIGPTTHWSFVSLALLFENILPQIPLVLRFIDPMIHWSYDSLALRPIDPTHWNPDALRLIGPTAQ